MHALITGGTGFIGQALVPELLAAGWSLTVLTRRPAAASQTLPAAVRCVSELPAVQTPVQAVVNLAGESLAARRWTARRKQTFFDSRVGLTETLVAWMQAQSQPPAVLVSGSAVGYYGAQGNTPLDESADPVDEYQHRLCRDWEAAASQATVLGTRVVRLRIGVVLDRHGGALQAMLPPYRLGLGGWLGSGQQWMSWIHRRDLVALILLAMSDPQLAGAVNAVAPTPVKNRQFSKALGAALHRPVWLPVPALVLKALVGEMAHLLLTGQRVLPEAASKAGFDYEFDTVDAAFADIFG